ncbi:aryl hydrocarbon receptor-like isoform X2 [Anarrhichthys ocellatus]|uniref:aryl hydrocarbon receptor-like isoform X2 n=1 Tax=Anarrhichthys ocellatus TaxID=433405 RepID=UPI0012EDECCF|nr:aryl hydrocarbon receptor-like isoform X2 [Anarrhichthys ocellatus]
MLGNPGSYANKKRKKPVLKQKKASESNDVVKSNPSKRHRDRLNGELDRLTDLLPFLGEVRSRLDKLSVLRLSVGYLRVKSYFKATMNTSSSLMFSGVNGQNGNSMDTSGFSEGDLLLQALNGFVMVVTSDGSVFYVSSTVKDYLGFHQSDVVHQSVFELIHTDDRSLFRQQLHFALNPPSAAAGGDVLQSAGSTVMYSPEQLPPENSSFLERSFVCRFRCLLDNSSGFLALKFQGRLKYVHGQKVSNGNCNKPQLALFAIAVPVQPPTIVEIRAKMLLFQTKHKLDFTPMGVDSRGKIILGYSEIELCMKGSGYQFIHAADMMYCADSHIRMIKTGETGLTVFRLLTKSGGWVWVKSNAKLIYKGGRPEFIIAYQRALVNAEGEEYLRRRRLQLPFSFTTGEGVLYNTGPSVDVSQFQFNTMFSNVEDMKKDVTPGSLLDCFLSQDQSVYMQVPDTPLPMDQVFMDSQALVSVAGEAWQERGDTAAMGDAAVVVKEEAKQSIMAVIDNLEKMAQDGDFCSALQDLDVSDVELMEWENTLKRLSQDGDQQSNVKAELDSILTNDIFDFIDTVLFKQKGDASPPSCLTAANNNQQDPFTQAGLGEPQLFETPSPDRTYSPMNGLYARQQETMNGPVIAESAQIFTQKLSHLGPLITQADPNLPAVQQLQLRDIFSPSIELPELTVPDASAPFPSCGRAPITHMGGPLGISAQTQPGQLLRCPQNSFPAPAIAPNGQLLQSSARQPNNVAPGVMNILPPLIPCNAFNSISTPTIPVPFATTCLQGSPSFETHCQQVQQWPQSRQQKPPHAGLVQNGHELMPARHSQTPGSQTLPRAGLWPSSVAGLNHAQPGGLTCSQAVAHSSCMFDQHFASSPAGGDVLALSGSSGLRGADASLDQSPPQGSCYFQWSHSESVVGTSAINQEKTNISPPSMSEHSLNIQHYLECHQQTQDERVSAELSGVFATPAQDVAVYLAE